jgi:hypothetical protein
LLGAGQFLAALLFQTEAYDGWIVSSAVIAICLIARHDARRPRFAYRSDEGVTV